MLLGLWKEAGKESFAVGMNCSCQNEEQRLVEADGLASKRGGESCLPALPVPPFPYRQSQVGSQLTQGEIRSTEPRVQRYKAGEGRVAGAEPVACCPAEHPIGRPWVRGSLWVFWGRASEHPALSCVPESGVGELFPSTVHGEEKYPKRE